jgi:RNA polymerase sigma-70 factor (ECF subfamily)
MDESHTVSPELLERVRDGEEAAWQQLVDTISPLVFKIIRNQVRRTSDHEDLGQEAFTKIFLKLNQFVGKQPFHHWVSRVTINTCYDWLRKQKVRPLSSFSDLGETQAEIVEKTLTAQSSDQEEDLAAMRDLLERLISSLKPREQIVIRLLDLEENSVKEVCEITGWGESKVKVTAMRARKKLAEQLKHINPEEIPL